MAPPQAHPRDKLARIGKEGFDLLDELFPKKHGGRLPADRTCVVHRQASAPQVIRVVEPVVDSNQAVQFFGGGAVFDHPMRRNIRWADY